MSKLQEESARKLHDTLNSVAEVEGHAVSSRLMRVALAQSGLQQCVLE